MSAVAIGHVHVDVGSTFYMYAARPGSRKRLTFRAQTAKRCVHNVMHVVIVKRGYTPLLLASVLTRFGELLGLSLGEMAPLLPPASALLPAASLSPPLP